MWCRLCRSCRRSSGPPQGCPAWRTRALGLADLLQGLADRRQYPKTEHVNFHEADRVDVILVPLDDRAIGHAGVLDRHEPRQRRPLDRDFIGSIHNVEDQPGVVRLAVWDLPSYNAQSATGQRRDRAKGGWEALWIKSLLWPSLRRWFW